MIYSGIAVSAMPSDECSRANRIPDDATVEAMARLFKALADPTRIRIVAHLKRVELSVGELAEEVGISISAVSHQLGMLRDLRLVRVRREGRHVYYALDDDHIESLFQCCLDHVEHTDATDRH